MNNNVKFNKITKKLSSLLNKNNYKRILIITGKNSFNKTGAYKIVKKILNNKNYLIYFKKNFIPEYNELKKIIFKLKRYNPDIILAIGGGTVIDYAKVANLISASKKKINLNFYKKKYNIKHSKLIAIPTTAGSGAEVTSSAVIYLRKKKYSIENKLIKPDNFFLIPKLILSQDINTKRSSGFDAISQAIESLISKKSNKISENFAKRSLNKSLNNFLSFLTSPNAINSKEMCLAANLSGQAINITRTITPHAVSYPFTSHFGVSHGHAVSLTLEKFLKFTYEQSFKLRNNYDLLRRFKEIFKILKVKNILEFVKFIEYLKKRSGLESDFKNLGIDLNKDMEKILSGVNEDRLKNNPIKISINDIKYILLNY